MWMCVCTLITERTGRFPVLSLVHLACCVGKRAHERNRLDLDDDGTYRPSDRKRAVIVVDSFPTFTSQLTLFYTL